MKVSDHRTGSAAAMLVTVEMTIGSLAALAVGVFHDDTARPLGLTIAALVASGLLAWRLKSIPVKPRSVQEY